MGRASLGVLGSVRARTGAVVETVAAHSSARIELAALRREVGRLLAERRERLAELGEAVYEGNRSATKQLKQGIEALDEEIKEKETQMANVTMAAHERIERAQLQVQPTQVLPGGQDVPEPATVPEPVPTAGRGPAAAAGARPGAVSATGRGRPAAAAVDPGAGPGIGSIRPNR